MVIAVGRVLECKMHRVQSALETIHYSFLDTGVYSSKYTFSTGFLATWSQVNIHTDFVTSFKLYFAVAQPAFALVIIFYISCSSTS